LNKFCNDCQHLVIAQFLKEEFNKRVKRVFLDCPTEDPKVAGCLIKFLEINWDGFEKEIRK
jgi:hypothetical protein